MDGRQPSHRIGKPINKSKPRSIIIACLETEKQKYAAVEQADRLNHSTHASCSNIMNNKCTIRYCLVH